MSNGKFYGLGIGPGDPELLTLKANRILQSVPVIAYPACKEGAASYASKIVQGLIPKETKQMSLLFPMLKDIEPLQEVWNESLEKIYAELEKGSDVAFITEGDPFFYSTFLHMYKLMKEKHPDISITVVPGVTSITAAAVAADVPLTQTEDKMAIIPATYDLEGIKSTIEGNDVTILMKVSGVFNRVVDILDDSGYLDSSVFIERAGSKDERIVHDIKSLRGTKVNYLSLIIVKKP